ncbi:hypothetical protein [Bradyrhizobium guangzhouense]|uniref:hypothetical protein n=1 Tax=Bradyrhizobium guangzhouense TaxID=1325095 RepID=UPI001009D885|nr:hypothetical protein [Bradyrhizobium guangzhouense]RXH15220.1 hypothetical protein EAS54_19280 [Bradyrhizobium guangzhouense]
MTEKYIPGRQLQPIKDSKERFAVMVAFVADRGGWVTSTPGASAVTIDVLPGSTLPDELSTAGYRVERIGEGERILPGSVVVKYTTGRDGELRPITEGSTAPVTMTQRHAGIARVVRYSFGL